MSWLIVFKNNWKRDVNRKKNFLIKLIVPILVVVIGIGANVMSKPSFMIGVIGEYKDNPSIQMIQKMEGFQIEEANPKHIDLDLITGKYSIIVQMNENKEHTFHSIKDEKTTEMMKDLIENGEESAMLQDKTLIEGVLSELQRMISFLILFLMIMSTLQASSFIKDKTSGTYRRYCISPNLKGTYLLGNLVYNFSITFLQYMIAISIVSVLPLQITIGYRDFIILGLLITSFTTAFGTFFSTLCVKELNANLSATSLALVLSLIGGSFIALQNMPKMLRYTSVISPTRWFNQISLSLEQGHSLIDNANVIGIIMIFMIGLFSLSFMLVKRK